MKIYKLAIQKGNKKGYASNGFYTREEAEFALKMQKKLNPKSLKGFKYKIVYE